MDEHEWPLYPTHEHEWAEVASVLGPVYRVCSCGATEDLR